MQRLFWTERCVELQKSIKSAKIGKACGADGIHSEFLKFHDGVLDEPLLTLYNYIFDNSVFPSAWSVGLINPIYKQNDKTLPENYRKVTLLPSISKISEGILNNRLEFCKETMLSDEYR